ncbi:ATP-binding cassette domain-containing protein [Hyphomicrobium sp. MC1]|uniref:ATP-binding cassette domain-containing protein n=1 Tax=Hyphomicrobium sp. (strain MC1) TaxID=717785 RepID=UPI000213E91F|nr:ATP-binding cassette domain-containing protein [Hyphomicrobium sp. MC1]CCB66587.1 High-affinity branched-chain amino acid transport ATP-binding protein livF (LIV-I protein F) [Hyphomicrobium sp. MC1]
MASAGEDLLSLKGMSVAYDGKYALNNMSFNVRRGESVALVGSNGAGKTSLLSAIAGILQKGQIIDGQVFFNGENLPWGAIKTRRRVGIGLVPEKDKVFHLLTVDENLEIGRRAQHGRKKADAFDWFPRLAERRKTQAGNLSGGEQQMLALAMALLASPKLLLLDEPSLGLATPVVEMLCQSLRRLRNELSLTILVAESDTQWIPHLSDRAIVIDRGWPIATFDHIDDSSLETMHGMLLGLVNSSPAST